MAAMNERRLGLRTALRPGLFGLAAALAFAGAREAEAQPACTGPESPIRLYVNVENVRAGQGLIAVTLYADDSSKFLARRGALYVGRVPARTPATRVCIHLPSTGTYAIAVYHDADSDRSFNAPASACRRKDTGFSNNPGTFSAFRPSVRSGWRCRATKCRRRCGSAIPEAMREPVETGRSQGDMATHGNRDGRRSVPIARGSLRQGPADEHRLGGREACRVVDVDPGMAARIDDKGGSLAGQRCTPSERLPPPPASTSARIALASASVTRKMPVSIALNRASVLPILRILPSGATSTLVASSMSSRGFSRSRSTARVRSAPGGASRNSRRGISGSNRWSDISSR